MLFRTTEVQKVHTGWTPPNAPSMVKRGGEDWISSIDMELAEDYLARGIDPRKEYTDGQISLEEIPEHIRVTATGFAKTYLLFPRGRRRLFRRAAARYDMITPAPDREAQPSRV